MPIAKDLWVLVVDDQPSMRGITRMLLGKLGIRNVVEASDGAFALKHVSQRRFSLVISDWHMEGMDGLMLFREMRANPVISGTPFIMSTSDREKSSVKEALDAGVRSYIVKPFDAEALRGRIEGLLGTLM